MSNLPPTTLQSLGIASTPRVQAALAVRERAIATAGAAPNSVGASIVSVSLSASRGVKNASGTSLSNGDGVATWTDTRIGGFVASQATSASQPTYIQAGYGAMPVIRFSGAQTLSIPDNVALRPDSGGFHIFMVVRNSSGFVSTMLQKGNSPSTVAGYTMILDVGAATAGVISSYVRCGGASSSRGSQGFASYPETFNLIELALDGSTITGFLNGTNTGWVSGGEGPAGNTYTAPISNTDPLVIGSTGAIFDIAELMIVKGTPTADQIALCRNYYMTEYAIGVPNAANLGTPQVMATAGSQFPDARIPALVKCANGDVLAFYEGRSSTNDNGFIQIAMLRSTNGGASFTNLTPQIVTTDGVNTFHNPCPILDAVTGNLILLTSWNLAGDSQATIIAGTSTGTSHAYQQVSTDNGHTWSAPVDISAMAKPAGSTWWNCGPGGQKQLASGRLLIPCYNNQPSFTTTVPLQSNSMYSDDHGVTWTVGSEIVVAGTNEWRISQRLSDGLIYGLIRDDNSPQVARSVTSPDQGITLNPVNSTNGVVDIVAPPCNRGLSGDGTNLLVCSHPYSINASRINLTINLSTDFGATWPASTLALAGTCGYSEICALGGGLYGLFYETTTGSLSYVTFTIAYPAYSA